MDSVQEKNTALALAFGLETKGLREFSVNVKYNDLPVIIAKYRVVDKAAREATDVLKTFSLVEENVTATAVIDAQVVASTSDVTSEYADWAYCQKDNGVGGAQ